MTARLSPAPRPGLKGRLRLVCALDDAGRSHLREQAFSVPFHLSKPFHEEDVLVVNVVNPTAGLFSGDSLTSFVHVGAGARLLVTAPSATRVHDTQGGFAQATQEFSAAAGARLEILPELFIPHRGARYRQRTKIRLEPGAELSHLEMLAPGRVASGEIFAFEELDWNTRIWLGPRLIVRERFKFSPHGPIFHALAAFSPQAYLATFFFITDRFTKNSPCWAELDSLSGDDLWIGFSQLVHGGWVVKILARESVALRKAVAAVRRSCHASAGWPVVLARKI